MTLAWGASVWRARARNASRFRATSAQLVPQPGAPQAVTTSKAASAGAAEHERVQADLVVLSADLLVWRARSVPLQATTGPTRRPRGPLNSETRASPNRSKTGATGGI